MANLDDLAQAAEEAEVANLHNRPVTDADLGETATEGAQVVIDGAVQTAAPVASAQPLPEMQLPQPVATPIEQAPTAPAPVVTVQTPAAAAAPAPLPETDKAPQLTPFNEQITTDTAPTPATPVVQIEHPDVAAPAQPMQSVTQQPMQAAQPMAEQPSAPPAPGTMPGQTVSPQSVTTTPSHIIPESFPKPATGVDPLSGIAV